MATNTSESALTYYDGFYYSIQWDGIGGYTWRVYDSTQQTVVKTGYVTTQYIGYSLAITAAKDWIDTQNSSDIGDAPWDEPNPWVNWLNIPCSNDPANPKTFSIQLQEKGFVGDDPTGLYRWRVLDGTTVLSTSPKGRETNQNEAASLARDYVSTLADCQPPKKEEENGTGIGGKAKILNTAGFWTVGVTQGTALMIVPMVTVGIAVGFMMRVVRLGAKAGGA